MTVKYKTVITKAGAEKLAAASVPNGKKVNFVAMAVGDGGGKLPEPNASQTKLVNEVWRHALNKISQDKKHKNYVVAELVIPPETGGFWLREMGLYDDTGTLIAVGNMAESYKPELAEGSGRAQTLRMVIMVSDIETVELSIDTTLVMATQDYVDDKLAEHEQSRRHPDATLKEKGFTQLSSATDSASEALAATPKAVKAVYDFASAKYTAQDASTAQKGIVQLSSATDSVSETLAATPKAVKAVYDFANAKYTAQDATTARKGIVQLTSVTDSTSEAFAATPKAVKAANDNANGRVPSGRKVNGRPLTDDISVTAQDIFNGQAVAIGNAADLNAYTTPGLYFQAANAQASAGKNYPEAVAGSLEVYKHAGFTQIYRVYNNSRSYIRTIYGGVWTAWTKQYDVANKPTPAEIGALASNGNAVSATRLLNARKIAGVAFDGTADIAIPAANVGAYTKAETDNKYQAKGSYTPAGQAYTKAESDARFQKINTASLAANGWFRDTNTGMLIQYGKVAVTSDGQGFTFPVAFSLVPSLALTVNSGAYGDVGASSVSTTGFVVKAAAKNTVGFIAMGK
ncbi:phage tail-collar fiber domain-containing protein [Lelliottia nimipressuralis]|uniref:Phage tail protein n=2 Tax=Bacteria TaxID=2 RepID=A0ABY3P7K5_9ENTR|nr:phage tail protein [Lelliottia nimipressuralis]RXJ11464.1 phage tail protein [Lelliottia nimipressuralis]TYT35718.1 phage tail protein [Lelliottia nimipressuralis]